ncbi:FAD/NAD(P)-binding protein [Sphingomonas sp. LHG3406-1]|uniref:FAD/NAD(P)-binding protein n=1 Tax=Sphingomonas sp. LHG3406-1 TaxID=2804617 RepID=UPI00260A1292|nr:FAD/NAD(P)-binding protein [Sphingomonas sp. LHG3406-1]
MRSDAAVPVAVVGGGFSGVMTAVQLARHGVPVRLFDGGERPGRGVAYGTRDEHHLLNVPAAKMSAFPHDPDHFRAWGELDAGEFARRCDYGRYLDDIRAEHPGVTLEPMSVAAIERAGDGYLMHLADGGSVEAAGVVLALGNEAPAIPRGWEGIDLLANPWSPDAAARLREAAAGNGDILLIGTGLTMVDLVLSLTGLGFEGRMIAVSRRGLLPRAHGPAEPAPVLLEDVPQRDLMALWRWLRRRSAEVDYRAAVDSLRPHTGTLWQSLSLEQRRRFLCHARPWWDVHRHRIAPQVSAQLRDLIAAGRLEIIAGRLARADGGELLVSKRGGGERRIAPMLAVNCTGPLGDVRASANPLLRQLLADGLAGPDPLNLGLQADEQDRVGEHMWAVGPLTKGMYWEMVAVPDIRHQAERVALAISKELAAHG